MCGRFSIAEFEGIEERFQLEIEYPDLKPNYNVAPSQNVPVILNNGSNQLALFKWGLIPHWAKDPSIGHKLINARAETVDEKPSFKTCLQRKRCLIVADGFYEWKKEEATIRPRRITLKDQGLFGFAGLWDTWKSPTGEIVNSCTIITTTPNELMEPLHNRMPVILPREVDTEGIGGKMNKKVKRFLIETLLLQIVMTVLLLYYFIILLTKKSILAVV